MTASTRRALAVLAVLLAVLMVGFGALSAASWAARESATERESHPEPVRRIDLESSGRITVVGRDGPGVDVERTLRWSFRRPDVEQRVEGDTLIIRAECRWPVGFGCEASYVVTVPADTQVRVRTTAGSVEARGLRAGADLLSSAGGLQVSDSAGDLRLRTSAGSVRAIGLGPGRVDAESSAGGVRLAFATAPDRVRAHSSAGSVTVELPHGPQAYAVEAESSAGSTDVGVRTDPASPRVVDVSSSTGSVEVRYR
jgi:hypothetical protein